MEWNCPELGVVVKSLENRDVRTRLSDLPPKLRLGEATIFKMVKLAAELNDVERSVLAFWSYHFLLRVQSEAVPLEAGAPANAQDKLQEDCHSAVWVSESRIYMRLRRRKHRPQGSLLIRECCCDSYPGVFCPGHRGSLRHSLPGQVLFPGMTSNIAKKKLIKYLTLLDVPAAATATLKSFRSSKATNLALSGRPLPYVLAAGEWKSAAVMNSVDESAFDKGAFLRQAIENSSDEES